MAKHTRCPVCALEYHRIIPTGLGATYRLIPCNHRVRFDEDGYIRPAWRKS